MSAFATVRVAATQATPVILDAMVGHELVDRPEPGP